MQRNTGNSVFDNALKMAQIESLKERRDDIAARRAAEKAQDAQEKAAEEEEEVKSEVMNLSSVTNAAWTLAQNGGIGNTFGMSGSSSGSTDSVFMGREYYSGSEEMEGFFHEASQVYGLSVKFLKAVAKHESSFRPEAVSYAGAVGVMQLMPGTAASLGVTDSYDAEQNIMGGAKLLKQLLDKYNGDLDLTLAAYNAGEGNVAKYGGVPPFAQVYVDGVKEKMREQGASESEIYTTGERNDRWFAGQDRVTPFINRSAGYGTYLPGTDISYRNVVDMLRMQMLMNSTSNLGVMDFR
jgi:hypothetical protein